jgi:hypothetical protein
MQGGLDIQEDQQPTTSKILTTCRNEIIYILDSGETELNIFDKGNLHCQVPDIIIDKIR